jgi:hypothetical protein
MEKRIVEKEVQLEHNHVRVRSEDDLMSITMPDDDTVLTFWVERGEMILTTIRGDQKNARPIPRPV